MLPELLLEKKSAIWCNLSILKNVIINLKIINVKDNKFTIKIIDHIFLQYQNQGFRILM